MIVIMSLMILTTATIEFLYTERINYQLAMNAKERLQAYYLARSALNFSKVLLKYQKEAEKALESAGSAGEGMATEPLYKMIPLSSTMIRSAISGSEASESSEKTGEDANQEDETVKEEGEEGKDEEVDSGLEDFKQKSSLLSQEEAREFLNFTGDFTSEITEEQTKFDLNKIGSIVSTSASYDQRKKLLLSFLLLPKFKSTFENQEQDAELLVHNLSDWVDSNGVINEFENVSRGSEDSEYSGVDYKVKNGKMMTLSEIRLIAGMNDDIFGLLGDFVTIYTGEDKINVCLAEEEDWVKAMIYHYTHNAGCSSPVEYSDEEKMSELVTAVLGACDDADQMASALNTALGLVSEEVSEDDSTDESTTDESKTSSSDSSTSSSGSTVSECSFQFKDLLTSDNKIFRVRATGNIDETELSINVVMNIDSSDPTKWKYYYYRVE